MNKFNFNYFEVRRVDPYPFQYPSPHCNPQYSTFLAYSSPFRLQCIMIFIARRFNWISLSHIIFTVCPVSLITKLFSNFTYYFLFIARWYFMENLVWTLTITSNQSATDSNIFFLIWCFCAFVLLIYSMTLLHISTSR